MVKLHCDLIPVVSAATVAKQMERCTAARRMREMFLFFALVVLG